MVVHSIVQVTEQRARHGFLPFSEFADGLPRAAGFRCIF
jgi:hypothetical protein